MEMGKFVKMFLVGVLVFKKCDSSMEEHRTLSYKQEKCCIFILMGTFMGNILQQGTFLFGEVNVMNPTSNTRKYSEEGMPSSERPEEGSEG